MTNTVRTLAELEDFFLTWLAKEVAASRARERTHRYYRNWLKRFTAAAGGDRRLAELVPLDLERFKSGWHSVQTVQRLFNWGCEMGILDKNPFAKVKKPPLGQRQRVLSNAEMIALLRACRKPLRDILQAQRWTMARPQELRALHWRDYRAELSVFLISDFKAKDRRRDGARWRVLPVCPRMARLLGRLQKSATDPAGMVFHNSHGLPWSCNALRLAVRRAARRAGLEAQGQEHVVAYTLRHTAATNATANGVRDRLLADLMGHTSTRTTARYQHLQTEHLVEAIQQATQRRRKA